MFPIRSKPAPRNLTPISTHPLLSEDATDERTQRHLRQCRRLAELGMELAELAAQHAKQDLTTQNTQDPETPTPTNPDPHPPKSPDHGLLFTRFARSVRQAIALESRLIAHLQDAARAPRATPPDPRRRPLRRAFHSATANRQDANGIRLEAADRSDAALDSDASGALSPEDLFRTIATDLGIDLGQALPLERRGSLPNLPTSAAPIPRPTPKAAPPARPPPKPHIFADLDSDKPGAWWSNHLPQQVRDG